MPHFSESYVSFAFIWVRVDQTQVQIGVDTYRNVPTQTPNTPHPGWGSYLQYIGYALAICWRCVWRYLGDALVIFWQRWGHRDTRASINHVSATRLSRNYAFFQGWIHNVIGLAQYLIDTVSGSTPFKSDDVQSSTRS